MSRHLCLTLLLALYHKHNACHRKKHRSVGNKPKFEKGAYTVHFSENVVFTEKHERNVDGKKPGVAIGRGG